MPRWKWHMTRTGDTYPLDPIGPATDYAGQTGAYSSDYAARLAEWPELRACSDPDLHRTPHEWEHKGLVVLCLGRSGRA